MIGALIGDISGSRYERMNRKSKEFELFDKKCRPTDDSIMSLAVAKAILECEGKYNDLSSEAIKSMQELGRIYKNAGYGGSFIKWIMDENPQPYNSYGNGSAMRVGPCGYAAKSIEEAKELSEKVTKISHDHPEGMKGAEAIAVAVFLANSGKSKEEIKDYITSNYYEIEFTIDQIRAEYKFDVSCQGSVPVALEAFFEATDFEDAIRNAISVGGDSDTIAAMAGSIAEAYFGIPEEIIGSVIDYLDSREMEILYYFEKNYPSKALDEDGEASRTVFDVIDDYVDRIIPAGTEITVDDEYPSGAVHGWVDKDAMVPDFSSFDKSDRVKEAKEFLAKAGSDIWQTGKKAGAEMSKTAVKAGKILASKAGEIKENIEESKKTWYAIIYKNEDNDGWSEEGTQIIEKASELGIETGYIQAQGMLMRFVHCTRSELDKLMELLGDDFSCGEANATQTFIIKKNIAASKSSEEKEEGDEKEDKEKKKKDKLDDLLKDAITEYNATYTLLNDHGTRLFYQRERAIDLIDIVESLINSIANHPKEFDADIEEIQINKKEFQDVCVFAKQELEAAQKSAMGVASGVAGGMAVASLAPGAAMWVATTFGTASTGTAISALSGAAAESAALAWLGGGALTAGGGGMAAGEAFLAMAGPIGWGVAGVTLLASIVLFANKKMKLEKEKKEEIESVLKNTEQLKETDDKLTSLLEKTEEIREGLSRQYISGMSYFGKDFMDISDEGQTLLGTIVNNTKALAVSLGQGV